MIDLETMSLEEIVTFAFDHPPEDADWMWQPQWRYWIDSGDVIVGRLTAFFRDPISQLGRFSREQVEAGMWFIAGPNGFTRFITQSGIDICNARACVASMRSLFDQLFARDPLETSCLMWFDNLFTYCGTSRMSVVTDARIRPEVQLLLEHLLMTANTEWCVESALHGVNHLHHIEEDWCSAVIDEFVASRGDSFSEHLRTIAPLCRAGLMM